MERVQFLPVAAGLGAEYLVPMVIDPEDDEQKKFVKAGAVGVGAMVGGASTAVAVGSAVADYALCKLYEAVPALSVLTPIKGAIAVATSQMVMPYLGM